MPEDGRRVAELSYFFPAHNEEANLGPLVGEALLELPRLAERFEIVIVDDGSRDETPAIADRLALMRHAMHVLFGGRPTFQTCWTYISARKAGEAPRATAGTR